MDTLAWLALGSVVVVWTVYRMERWNTRGAVIEGLRYELAMHKLWVGTAYPPQGQSWSDESYLVHRLGTVATDDAIVRGPGVFLNPQVGIKLVVYRQTVTHVNQLIDQAMAFQATPALWQQNPPNHVRAHMLQLIEAVHVAGIGDDVQNKAAHWHFGQLEAELLREMNLRALPAVWAVTGVNVSFVAAWAQWLRHRLTSFAAWEA